MRNNISIQQFGTVQGQAGALRVEFTYPDRYKSQAATRELVRHLISSMPELQLVDPATLPERAGSPNRVAMAGYGILAGVLLGAAAQWRRKRNLTLQPA